MTDEEFIALIKSSKPSLDDYRRAVRFVESADIETLWAALNTKGVHWIFVAIINKALQEKVVKANLAPRPDPRKPK